MSFWSVSQLVSINVGMPIPHLIDGRQVTTGVVKLPAVGPVRINRMNAAGDGQGTTPNHGGPDQALSVYSTVHYRRWGERYGRDDLTPGIFGENLTVEDMTEAEVCIGDVLEIGTTTLQVSHPRIPCFRLSYRLGIPLFHDVQLEEGLIGYLLRVLKEGEIEAGDRIVLIDRDSHPVSVADSISATLLGRDLPGILRRLAELPHLSDKWRKLVSAKLGSRTVVANA